jgi:outer membrane protein assembly factor BamA
MAVEAEHPELQFNVGYSYGALPFDFGARVYRTIAPRGGYQLGSTYHPSWAQEAIGAETSITKSLPNAFDGQAVSLAYSFQRIGGDLPQPAEKLDPYETPQNPSRGLLANLHLGWSYSNAQRFLWSVANEKGFSLSTGLDWTDPWLGSEFSGFAATGDFSFYQAMPWLRHHALGVHVGAGTSGGNVPGRGPFYVGGFVDLPLYDTVRNQLIQGGIVLRGYPTVIEAGRSYALFNAEYRFPIWNVDRGPSTLPFFFNRISGAAFVDYGSAFNDAATAEFKTGVGGELWFDSTFVYVIGFTFRLGYARGLASGGVDKVYVVAAVPF